MKQKLYLITILLLFISLMFNFFYIKIIKHYQNDNALMAVTISELQRINEIRYMVIEQLCDELELEKKNKVVTITARVTAYAPLDNVSGICADENPEVTATGIKPRIGIVAVDPSKIPYGTQLFVPGYGYAVAEDTGAIIRNYDGIAIDVVMDSYVEAINWGVKYLEIQIL